MVSNSSHDAPKRPKVLVAMSGGVDSSVAACLLHEQGYDVVGVFMRLGVHDPEPGACTTENASATVKLSLPLAADSRHSRGRLCSMDDRPDRHRGCCSAADATDARVVAGKLGIPFYALNFQEDFSRLIDHFVEEYAAARTPNPCVRCNTWLKFGRLMEYADAIQADLIATGHYARVDHSGERPRLLRARHLEKDQSYVLFGVPPDTLRRTLFPLGALTKAEVRAEARRFGLILHDKPESQDICFVPDRDYARVVRERRPDAFAPGDIRHVDGRFLGHHEGVANFTVGQRRGVRIAVGSPVYVSEIDAESNTVTVGPLEAVLSHSATASSVQWLCPPPTAPFRGAVRIRYNHEAAPATIRPLSAPIVEEASRPSTSRVAVSFDEPQFAVTPGQALVIYNGDEVLGGGWIDSPAEDQRARLSEVASRTTGSAASSERHSTR